MEGRSWLSQVALKILHTFYYYETTTTSEISHVVRVSVVRPKGVEGFEWHWSFILKVTLSLGLPLAFRAEFWAISTIIQVTHTGDQTQHKEMTTLCFLLPGPVLFLWVNLIWIFNLPTKSAQNNPMGKTWNSTGRL